MDIEQIRIKTADQIYISNIKQAINNKDFIYIVELIEEIIIRINNLTPNRYDLHDELKSAVDLVLIKQMLDNNAFDSKDFYNIIEAFLQRIESLQAPIDQEESDLVRAKLLCLSNKMSWAEAVSPFFLDINKLIDRIELRCDEALRDPVISALIQRVKELSEEASEKN